MNWPFTHVWHAAAAATTTATPPSAAAAAMPATIPSFNFIQMNWVEFSNEFYTQKWGSVDTISQNPQGGGREVFVPNEFMCKCQCECGFWLFGVERHVCHLHELGTDMFLPTVFSCAHRSFSLFYHLFGRWNTLNLFFSTAMNRTEKKTKTLWHVMCLFTSSRKNMLGSEK